MWVNSLKMATATCLTRSSSSSSEHMTACSSCSSALSISNSGISMYHFQNTIGRGNFSVVKLAVHVPSQTKVAVKVTDKLRLTEDTSTLIAREIEILKSLKHPNIIGLFQVVSANSAYYIVNEYMDGGDLFELISKNGRLAELRSKCIFFQLANAVDYLHENHICHRDIKAENVLLTHSSRLQYDVSMMMNYLATNKRMDNNEFISLNKTPMLDIVKICDFGFSCRMTGKENAENGESKQNYELLKTWCGSPPYAAPELFEGQPYIGSRIDIWSLGVLLYSIKVLKTETTHVFDTNTTFSKLCSCHALWNFTFFITIIPIS